MAGPITDAAPATPTSTLGRAYARYVTAVDARPRRAGLLLLLACLPALFLTVRFFSDVRAGLEELLPDHAPSVQALVKLHERLGGKSHLSIVVQSPDVAANHRFIDELTARLEAAKIPEARSIQGRCATERKWIIDHALLLLPDEKFSPMMDEVEEALDHAKAAANPLFVDLDDTRPDPKEAWAKLEQRVDAETRDQRFASGYYEMADGKLAVILVWLEGSETDLGPAANLLGAVKREVDAIRDRYPPSLQVAWNGEVPNLVEEHDAILADLSVSSLIVFVLVGALIIGYFRSARAVFTVAGALVPGLLFAFALGRLWIGHLNSNTAFLGSIVAGNGVNYPLLVLAYYRTRPPGEARATALYHAARFALPGTLGAAVTASAAYAGLSSATFRGFSQFGWLGGVGMMTTWAMTMIAMPIAISMLDPPRAGIHATPTQHLLLRYFAHPRRPWVVSGLIVALALGGAGLGVRHALRHGLYEMDLTTLRNRDSLAHGSASWDGRMNQLFGVWLNPLAALVDDPAQRPAVAAELRRVMLASDGGAPAPAERVETIDLFAPPAAEQEARIARLRKVGASLHKLPEEDVPERLRPYVDTWFGEVGLRPIQVADVPGTLIQGFKEIDGESRHTVLLYPSLRINYNDGNNILKFADRLATARLPAGTVVGGSFLFMGEIIRLIRDEAPRVVVIVALLVALVLLPIFWRRPLRIPLVVITVATVALLAQAVMLALGVQLNMLNFAAVPITIGVGADYVVNLLGAMDAFQCDARRACARMGGGIFLCSLTTVVGYISLVAGSSGALRSFGWAAVLGESMAVITVLLILPVMLTGPEGSAAELAFDPEGEVAPPEVAE